MNNIIKQNKEKVRGNNPPIGSENSEEAMIRPSSTIVGIDIGKESHYAALLSANQPAQKAEVLRIANTVYGRERLRKTLSQYGQCTIAIEQVGGWSSPLDYQLLEDNHRLFTIHPLRLARARELYGQPEKTDSQDARFLALLLKQAQLGIIPEIGEKSIFKVLPMDKTYREIKQLSRHHWRLSKDYTRVKNRLVQLLISYNPGLKEIFSLWDGKACLKLLSHSPCPSQWKKLSLRTIISWFRNVCPGRVGRKRAKRVKQFGQSGNWYSLPKTISLEISHLAAQLLQLKFQKEKVLNKSLKLIKKTPEGRVLLTLPGCGLSLTATLIGELMPIDRFPSHNQLAMYVGATRIRHESGIRKGSRKAKIVNKRAKWAFRQLALLSRQHFAPSQKYCQKKEKEGKTSYQATLSLCRQLVKVVYSMLKNKEPFDPTRV